MKTLLRLTAIIFGMIALCLISSACSEKPKTKEQQAAELAAQTEYYRRIDEEKAFFNGLRVARVCAASENGARNYILRDIYGKYWVSQYRELEPGDWIHMSRMADGVEPSQACS